MRALKRNLGEQNIEGSLDKQPVDFPAWAEHYVDQLDPLSPTPHDADLIDESLRQYGNDEDTRQTLNRLIGRHWQEAWKIGETTDRSEETDLPADET